jgi:hypothetical protein
MASAPFDTLFLAISGARIMGDMPMRWRVSPMAESALWSMSGKDALGIYQMERRRGELPRLFGLPYETDRALEDPHWRLVTRGAWTYAGSVTEREVTRHPTSRLDMVRELELPQINDFYRRAFWLTPDWSGGYNLRDPGTEPFWMR